MGQTRDETEQQRQSGEVKRMKAEGKIRELGLSASPELLLIRL
jgi:hypothetical protein